MSEKPKTYRSYGVTKIDDNMRISLNLRWLGQIIVLFSGLIYSYYQIIFRIGELERRVSVADTTITELVEKHIIEENKRFEEMEEELKWHQKLLKKKKK